MLYNHLYLLSPQYYILDTSHVNSFSMVVIGLKFGLSMMELNLEF